MAKKTATWHQAVEICAKNGFSYWDIQQPDNWTGPGPKGEDYVVYWQHKDCNIRYRWNDQTGDALSGFILEKE